LFLGFSWVKIKSDDRYQQQISSDNHRPILYHMISFIQKKPTDVNRWVITDKLPLISFSYHAFFPAFQAAQQAAKGSLSFVSYLFSFDFES